MNRLLKSLLLVALAVLTTPAFSQTTVLVPQATVMYAGPGSDYPPIVQLYPGQTVQLYGCLQYSVWCDVSTYQDRGWVPGSAIGMWRRHQMVYLGSDPSLFGAPIIFFNLGTYWGQHYRTRPWYHQQRLYRHPDSRRPDYYRHDRRSSSGFQPNRFPHSVPPARPTYSTPSRSLPSVPVDRHHPAPDHHSHQYPSSRSFSPPPPTNRSLVPAPRPFDRPQPQSQPRPRSSSSTVEPSRRPHQSTTPSRSSRSADQPHRPPTSSSR